MPTDKLLVPEKVFKNKYPFQGHHSQLYNWAVSRATA